MSTTISWADQQKINEFSKLNARLLQHEKILEQLDQEKEILGDAEMELELVDEDELLSYKIGDTFVKLPQTQVMQRLEHDREQIDDKVSSRRSELEQVSSRMTELKSELYARFGNAINLERD